MPEETKPDVLGVIEWGKAQAAKPTEESTPVCVTCQSAACVVRIANAWHCNQCGESWGHERNPVGTLTRSAASGWPTR